MINNKYYLIFASLAVALLLSLILFLFNQESKNSSPMNVVAPICVDDSEEMMVGSEKCGEENKKEENTDKIIEEEEEMITEEEEELTEEEKERKCLAGLTEVSKVEILQKLENYEEVYSDEWGVDRIISYINCELEASTDKIYRNQIGSFVVNAPFKDEDRKRVAVPRIEYLNEDEAMVLGSYEDICPNTLRDLCYKHSQSENKVKPVCDSMCDDFLFHKTSPDRKVLIDKYLTIDSPNTANFKKGTVNEHGRTAIGAWRLALAYRFYDELLPYELCQNLDNDKLSECRTFVGKEIARFDTYIARGDCRNEIDKVLIETCKN